ncbi:N6-L-threonylcarbamoyladenine synthase [Alicyclobacillus tengchongensis]|uniref:tRNA N6-adenosine threonylcarbamoyltransferase n=2 Tax=Alicyclobacillus tolerans TaxID=90970 RepID=A0ABT9LZU3_9BACL|nr:tRNA (adenosine(37)-N6)-threonylcarbamoyltransferase complex transferase subunit TsaD [Alicyclobacillus tengchongensis]MDP9729651.1 N6-L-threonylcarbamoyladenine synthase [Alicyclobacillus tengchongensis]
MKERLMLGIETSCDETSAAVVADGQSVRSLVTYSQIAIHQAFGGVVPEVASRQHVAVITRTVEQALTEANVQLSQLDGIAVTCGPGLLGALLVGLSAAKGYALVSGLPFFPVHHIAGHVAAAGLEAQWRPPMLCLVVSGGHTELLVVDENFRFQRLGGTVDDAAGEAYDKVARLCGLNYPGGPEIDKLAAQGNPDALDLPRSFLDSEELSFSFSGLKSAVANRLEKARRNHEYLPVEDICASFQQAVLDVLVTKTSQAAKKTGLRRIVVAGGVAANRGLRQAMAQLACRADLEIFFPNPVYCTDNGAMIAAAGSHMMKAGRHGTLDVNAYANLSFAEWQNLTS